MASAYVTSVLFSLMSTATALQCFKCTDCVNCIGTPVNCTGRSNTCMEVIIQGHLSRMCVEKEKCTLSEASKWVSENILDKVTILFVGKEKAKGQIHCCQQDFCNGPFRNKGDYITVMDQTYCCKNPDPWKVWGRFLDFIMGSSASDPAVFLVPSLFFMPLLTLFL